MDLRLVPALLTSLTFLYPVFDAEEDSTTTCDLSCAANHARAALASDGGIATQPNDRSEQGHSTRGRVGFTSAML